MRKITREAADAFINGRNFNRQNMSVWHDSAGSRMYLHGNQIAVRTPDGTLRMTLAGWNTPTTRERLNGLLDVLGKRDRFYQRDFILRFGNIWALPGNANEVREVGSDEWITIT